MIKCFAYGKLQFIICMVLLALPALIQAQPEQSQTPPPVGLPLVREGTLAIHLQRAMAAGNSDNEAEAESNLAALGIVPRNGWIADYPVTPDIIGELYKSVRSAASSGKLSLGSEEAQQRLTDVIDELGLTVKPADYGAAARDKAPEGATAPPPDDLHEHYADEGPPVVTCYAPPQAYYTMYTWVPYPFWWSGFWFSGYFILNDFHRPVFIENRQVFISNHYRDIRRHRVFRIDPYQRYRGRTYSGIGVRRRDSISTGVPHSDRTIFNRDQSRNAPEGRLGQRQRRDAAPEIRIDRGQRGAAPPLVQPAPVPGRDKVPRGDDRGGVQRR